MTSLPAVPRPSATLAALVRAELRSLLRSWSPFVWTVAVPVLILVLGEAEVPAGYPHARTAALEIAAVAQTTGSFALGLFGYATVIAAYRERGVFQRLRCTPAPHWQLLAARMATQMLAVAAQALVLLVVLRLAYGVTPSAPASGLAAAAAFLAGVASLTLGQTVVALARSSAGVTAVSRLLLIALFVVQGVIVRVAAWPAWLERVDRWTPVYLASMLLNDSLTRASWSPSDLRDLAGLIAWVAALALVGLGRFAWGTST